MAKSKLAKVDTQARQLSFPLKPSELMEKNKQLVSVLGEIEAAEAQAADDALKAKEVQAGHNAKLNGLKKDVKTLREQITTASEMREVVCDVYDDPENSVRIVVNPLVSENHPERIVTRLQMTLIDKAEAEARNAEADAKLTEDEKAALADAQAAEAEAEAEPKPKADKKANAKDAKPSSVKSNGKANGKAKGKAAVSNAEIGEDALNMSPYVAALVNSKVIAISDDERRQGW